MNEHGDRVRRPAEKERQHHDYRHLQRAVLGTLEIVLAGSAKDARVHLAVV